MENTRKPDRRVIKTKRAIRNAFAELLSEKDINEITVKDISDTADINRKTFYNYYSGVHEVVDEIENEIVNTFQETMGDIDFHDTLTRPYIIFERLTEVVNSDFDFYSHLMQAKPANDSSLITKIINSLIDSTRESVSFNSNLDEYTISVMVKYSIIGMIGVYHDWFNSDRTQSIEDLSKTISTLCYDGINGLISEAGTASSSSSHR